MKIKLQRLDQFAKADATEDGRTLEEYRTELIALCQEVLAAIKDEGRDLTAEENEAIEKATRRVTEVDRTMQAAKRSAATAAKFKGHAIDQDGNPVSGGVVGTKYIGLSTPAGIKSTAAVLAKGMTNPRPVGQGPRARGHRHRRRADDRHLRASRPADHNP
ncbi:MAG: hypothetical protein U5N21_04840 [Rhodococcus sp. (in: high G+C Gram-positive bacteria)]|nr:hypothetical protein [Rhodococcus sp. (in: high G+C Gram-positive bacteria)]